MPPRGGRWLAHGSFVAALWIGLGLALPEPVQAQAKALPAFTATVTDGVFAPARLVVPAGERVKIILKNEGPGPLEFENDDMRIEKIVAAGAGSFVVLPPLKPGTYEFIDEFNIATGVLVIEAQ